MAIDNISRQPIQQALTASGNVNVDANVVVCDATSGVITATLFTSPGDGALHQVVITKTDSSTNAVTVTDSTFSYSLTAQYDAVTCRLNESGAWFGVSGYDSSGTGDVEGPASATDNAVARFDGTTGKIIQDSVVSIADTTGVISGGRGITLSGSTSGSNALTVSATGGILQIGAAGVQIPATGKLGVIPKTNDTFASSMTIDVTISTHVIAVANGTSATCTMTPSAAGSAGDFLLIEQVADSSGTVTTTFASTFHSSGTQATTGSHFSTILFFSDGTRWVEVCRTTALA
jgi:hypothetical protein